MSMSPIAVAHEVIRTTLCQCQIESDDTPTQTAATTRAVLEALTAEGLLVTTEDLQRRSLARDATTSPAHTAAV